MMLNRVAEALFWIGRYTERAENHARLIDAYYHIREESETPDSSVWMRIIHAIGDPTDYLNKYAVYCEADVLREVTLDTRQSNSLLSCIYQARVNLRGVRERLPSELWDTMNRMYLWLKDKKVDDIMAVSPHAFYKQMKDHLAMFQGVFQSVMTRDELWYLAECGRYLERSENTVRLLYSVYFSLPEDRSATYPYLLAVLKAVSGYGAYRRIHNEELDIDSIVAFLIRHDKFPRSVFYCVAALEGQLKALRKEEGRGEAAFNWTIRLVGKIRSELEFLDMSDIRYNQLGTYLQDMHVAHAQLGQALAKAFFHSERNNGGVGA